jgi:hypothetical protein
VIEVYSPSIGGRLSSLRTRERSRWQAVDIALDGEQGVHTLHRLDGDQGLVEPSKVEELVPRMCPAASLDDRATLRPGS